MPRFDGTGPAGQGPMTGWGQGHCNPGERPYNRPMPMASGYGRSYGSVQPRGFFRGFLARCGRGRGRGRGSGRQGILPYGGRG